MMEPTLADVTGLIGQIYQAAYEPDHWNTAVKKTREMFNGSTACLTHHTKNKVATWAFSANPDYGFFQKYVDEFTDTNPYLDSLHVSPLQTIIPDSELFDIDAFRRSTFWNEWMKPQDMYDGLCCKLSHTFDSVMFFDVRRGSNQAPFDRKDEEILTLLIPHIERATQINDQMRLANALTTTFSRFPFGVVLVNADLRILEMNDLAGTILEDGQAELSQRNGILTAQSQSMRELKRLVEEACGLHMNGLVGSGGRMVVETSAEFGQMPKYVLEVAPVFESPFAGLTSGRCAIIMFKKINMSTPEGLDEQIRAIFKLTPSEARLAVLLADGYPLKEAATAAGLKNSTARAYLERLFLKTGTHQQSQLVALLKNVAPVLLKSPK